MHRLNPKNQGFILLPVVMALTLVASVAFMMNRDGADNVNRLAGEIATSQAEYVAKAGVNQMYWQANNSNCTGYSNATNVSFGGQATYTGSISPTSNSPVSISVTATQPQGASYSIRRDLLKVYQPQVTKTLQLGTQLGKDATIASAYTSNNFGATDDEVIVTWLFSWYYRNQLIQFDLASIPTNAHILSAQLQLYKASGSGKTTVNVYRLTRDWTEGTKTGSGTADGVTWKTYDGSSNWTSSGGDFDTTLIAKALVDAGTTGFQSWDISALVQNWLQGDYENYGVLLKVPSNTLFSAKFTSKEDSTVANRPKLVVTYNCECGLVCVGNDCIPGNYRDEFLAINYTGNQGSFSWPSGWVESGESDGVSAGKISVVSASQCVSGSCLKIRKDSSTVMGITRELDISKAKSAILTYSYRRTVTNNPGGGAVTLQISKDGGATFTALKSYAINVTDTSAKVESIDISAYAAAKTQIKFVTSGASYQSSMHIDNVDVAVSCSSKSVTLNPVADTYLNSVLLTANYGTKDLLLVGKDLTAATTKGLVKFDVSSIPATAVVTSVNLRLFGTAATGNGSLNIGIYKIIANWAETTATWLNFSAASNYKSTQLAVSSVPLAPGIAAEWSLPPSLINEWLASAASNYGVALVYENTTFNMQSSLASKENTNSALRPQLVINYTLP